MPPGNKNFFWKKKWYKLAHMYYLFIYVLTDTKILILCHMKVKDFINYIRPVTMLDPEMDIEFTIDAETVKFDHLHVDFVDSFCDIYLRH